MVSIGYKSACSDVESLFESTQHTKMRCLCSWRSILDSTVLYESVGLQFRVSNRNRMRYLVRNRKKLKARKNVIVFDLKQSLQKCPDFVGAFRHISNSVSNSSISFDVFM